ncbi:MAG: hypothetical protein JXQ30_15120 [Spirochaetes bacterium]|nr:hypothetical protein [Spirochaetota bacterium]
MRKYSIRVEGTEYIVEVDENAPGEYRVKVGDKVVTVTAQETPTEQSTAGSAAGDKNASGGSGDTAGKKTSSGTGVTVKVNSPMPGNVESVTVSKDAVVNYGDPIIILEAMKMKNEIPSPVKGIVREVLVKKGDTIDSEDTIAIIEEVNG